MERIKLKYDIKKVFVGRAGGSPYQNALSYILDVNSYVPDPTATTAYPFTYRITCTGFPPSSRALFSLAGIHTSAFVFPGMVTFKTNSPFSFFQSLPMTPRID